MQGVFSDASVCDENTSLAFVTLSNGTIRAIRLGVNLVVTDIVDRPKGGGGKASIGLSLRQRLAGKRSLFSAELNSRQNSHFEASMAPRKLPASKGCATVSRLASLVNFFRKHSDAGVQSARSCSLLQIRYLRAERGEQKASFGNLS
ncbi:replication factor subunit [Pseudozyma hubeiensis SY62]|uniref:Replication factor subunit n=1 Tax=Pseudozyma hubeiensis (strain SY62) TaxID=1305764 RepID=R9P8C8_PSEHS|nr:replication factor subunit [Pseudozyma hubeiensis SY62]GAC97626.1 replication factor subunit [Pseudozyma hubeiensis SY62]